MIKQVQSVKFKVQSLAALVFLVILFIAPVKIWAAAPSTPSISINSFCTFSYNYIITISWAASSPPTTWIDISSDNFVHLYHKDITGTTSTNGPIGFVGDSRWGTSGSLTSLQPSTTYYVRLWNGSLSGTATFTTPASAPNSCVTLSGRVTDYITGAGIPNVSLNQGYDVNPGPPACLIGIATTDANGNFSFTNIPYEQGFCLRAPASGVPNYTLKTGGFECQTAGRKYGPPDSCGAGGGNGDRDMAVDNAYNFTYSPPNCGATNPVCTGGCTGAAANTCTANGTKNGCTYNGNGTCTPIAAPNQTCDQPNCSTNYSCISGSCVLQDCNATPSSCGDCGSAPTNTCSTNNGTQTCNYTTLNGSTTCTLKSFNQVCTVNNCTSHICNAGVCDVPAASPTSCGTGAARSTGLVSTPTLTGNFNTTGACVKDTKATFAPYKLPDYDTLKSIYYTQAKTTNPTFTKHDPIARGAAATNEQSLDLSGIKDHLYLIEGDLIKRGGQGFPQDANAKAGVIFVEGDFTINSDIGYTGGLVFVVKGNVSINPSVTQINAVIISAEKIYTAGAGCTSNTVTTSSALTINGSLVSTYKDKDHADTCNSTTPPANCPLIIFCRTLSNNNNPAEVINQQPKYLVILKDLFADTLQKWSEIQ